jgi:hypothetical protein
MSSPNTPPRFQFSLRWLILTVTVVALLLGLWTILGRFAEAVVAALVLFVVPTPLVVAAIYGRGDLRTFSIGALVPFVMTWLRGPAPGFFSIALLLLSMLICGGVAVVTRRWLARRGLLDQE